MTIFTRAEHVLQELALIRLLRVISSAAIEMAQAQQDATQCCPMGKALRGHLRRCSVVCFKSAHPLLADITRNAAHVEKGQKLS